MLVVFLLVGSVFYYRSSTSSPVAASSSTSRSSPAPSSAVDTDTRPLTRTPTPTAGGDGESPSDELGPIQVYGDRVTSAEPFQTVQIRGTYHGAPDTFLRLQCRDGSRWVTYPQQPKTDWLGRFITHVELGEPGPHWLRMADPGADVASEPFVLVIED